MTAKKKLAARTRHLMLRLTERERAAVDKVAWTLGMTASEFARHSMEEAVKRAGHNWPKRSQR